MNDKLLSRIAPVSDEAALALVSRGALAELGDEIVRTATPQPRRRPGRGLAAIAVAAAAVVAIGVLTGVLAHQLAGRPRADSRAQLAALVFTTAHGYIDVVIRDPYADPAQYRAEFAAHHLDISLLMVPGSPSVVGTLVMGGGDGISVLTQPGRCADPGGSACPVGVRIPLSFHGGAQIAFARPARPGEQYTTTGNVTAPGEAMHGMRFRGRTVASVLAMLAKRHIAVAGYRDAATTVPAHVPGGWYVLGADPWAPGQVLLFVNPTPKVPAGTTCLPSAHGPVCAVPTRNASG
jgi:hypothetical protein